MGNSKSDMVSTETPKTEIQREISLDDQARDNSYDEEIDPDFDFPKVNFTITTFLLH